MRLLLLAAVATLAVAQPASAQRSEYDSLIASHAAANGVPADLVHRVIVRESRYNARAVGRGGTYGLMQIKLGTARALGYTGTAEGLRDPNTNLTYAVKYLAGAYRTAGGNHAQAVRYYASGYYYAAKRQRQAPMSAYGLAGAKE
jgi:soluble lytic murein transglycosylase-like protein